MGKKYEDRLSKFSQNEKWLNFKFRAECRHDVDCLFQEMAKKLMDWKKDKYNPFDFETTIHITHNLILPDLTVEIHNCPLTYNELISVLEKVLDSHVMIQSLNLLQYYDAKRLSEDNNE